MVIFWKKKINLKVTSSDHEEDDWLSNKAITLYIVGRESKSIASLYILSFNAISWISQSSLVFVSLHLSQKRNLSNYLWLFYHNRLLKSHLPHLPVHTASRSTSHLEHVEHDTLMCNSKCISKWEKPFSWKDLFLTLLGCTFCLRWRFI